MCRASPGCATRPSRTERIRRRPRAQGTCGTRTAWALTAQVPSGELPAGMIDPGTDPLLLLARALPQSGRFSSAVQRDVRFPLHAPIEGKIPPSGPLTSLDFQQVPLAFPFVVRVPPLPRFRDSYLSRALVVGSVTAPGQGTVPLGLGAAVNANPVDPNTDTQPLLSSPGLVRVRMAPAHHGLEGQAYRLTAVASSGAFGGEEPVGRATSAVMTALGHPSSTRRADSGDARRCVPRHPGGCPLQPGRVAVAGLLPREWRWRPPCPARRSCARPSPTRPVVAGRCGWRPPRRHRRASARASFRHGGPHLPGRHGGLARVAVGGGAGGGHAEGKARTSPRWRSPEALRPNRSRRRCAPCPR